jgi:hypothetical protein
MFGIILALDPGITTGRALARIEDDKLLVSCHQAVWSHRECFEFIAKIKPRQLVVESFEYRNQKRDNLELFSREIIGIAILASQLWPMAITYYPQSASQGKGFYSDQKLKSLGVYDEHNEHGRDALRHLLHWWTFGAGYQFNQKQKVVLVGENVLLRVPPNDSL